MNKTRDKSFYLRILTILALGFSSGLPFLITKDIFKAWLTEEGIDITQIGLVSGVALPYTLKFLWSPIMDRYVPLSLGRRRSWLIIIQVLLTLSIIALGLGDPKSSLTTMVIMAIVVSFFSASQDIVIDAFRREYLPEDELGVGSAVHMNAFRLANLASVGIGLALADVLGYAKAHTILASLMIVGIMATLLVKEPALSSPPPRTLKDAVVGPLQEFFSRSGALTILLFILLYKIGDNMASAMNVPFILKMGFEKTDYVLIVKGIGMGALFGGMLLGGVLMMKFTVRQALWGFGILQMASTACFGLLTLTGANHAVLTGIVVFELLSTGLGTTAYATFMAYQTNTKFTATQYALMSSIMSIPGTLAAMVTGYMVKYQGWMSFYVTCALVALPGLLLVNKVTKNLAQKPQENSP